MSIVAITPKKPEGVELIGLRRQGTNLLPRPEYACAEQDGWWSQDIRSLSPNWNCRTLTRTHAGRRHFDYLMVYVSKPTMIGKADTSYAMIFPGVVRS
jgi:hypothetical protein